MSKNTFAAAAAAGPACGMTAKTPARFVRPAAKNDANMGRCRK